jgi:dUTP pyrophosphatase
MVKTKLLVKRLSRSVPMPRYAHPGDAGLDICAAEELVLHVHQRKLIKTGLAIELPRSTEAQIRPRSGLALEHGVTVLNSPGTIDAGFRGELKVLLINLGDEDFRVEVGMKIAQLVVSQVTSVKIEETRALSRSKRGRGGFGSTS